MAGALGRKSGRLTVLHWLIDKGRTDVFALYLVQRR